MYGINVRKIWKSAMIGALWRRNQSNLDHMEVVTTILGAGWEEPTLRHFLSM